MDIPGNRPGEGIEVERKVGDDGYYLLVEQGFEIRSPTLAAIDDSIEFFVESSVELIFLAHLLRGDDRTTQLMCLSLQLLDAILQSADLEVRVDLLVFELDDRLLFVIQSVVVAAPGLRALGHSVDEQVAS